VLKSPCTRGSLEGKDLLARFFQNFGHKTSAGAHSASIYPFNFGDSFSNIQQLPFNFCDYFSYPLCQWWPKLWVVNAFDGMFSFFIFYFMHHFCPHSLLRLCKEKMQHWFWITTPPANKHRLWKTHETLTLLMFSFVFEGTSLGRTFSLTLKGIF
jgi:hypothetical protein